MINTERAHQTTHRTVWKWVTGGIMAGAMSALLCMGYQRMMRYAVPPLFWGTTSAVHQQVGAAYTPKQLGIEQKGSADQSRVEIPGEILERLVQIRDKKEQICNGFVLTDDGWAGSAGHCLNSEKEYSARHQGIDYPLLEVYKEEERDIAVFRMGGFPEQGIIVPLEFRIEPEQEGVIPIRVYGIYQGELFQKKGVISGQLQKNQNFNGSLPQFYYPSNIQVEYGMSGSIVLNDEHDAILGMVSFKMPGLMGTGIASADALNAFLDAIRKEEDER